MATLYFKVSSDWEQVVKLRQECEKLEAQLKKMDSRAAPAATKTLETQLASTKQQMMGLVTEAAKAGAVMENDFKNGIYNASQTVNNLSANITSQRGVIRQLQNELTLLKEKYRETVKSGGDTIGMSEQIKIQAAKLREQKDVLFGLTQQQAEARLSVKRLRDEYALFKKEAGETVEGNEKLSVSLAKTLSVIGGVTALKNFVSEVVNVRGQFQQLEIAFTTMLKSKEKADKLMAELVDIAAKTPFDLQGVASSAKQMLAYGSQVENVGDELVMLGNVAAGVGSQLSEIAYLYGTLRTQGRAYAVDIRQFAGRGIPIYEELAKVLGVTKDQVGELVTEGKVGFAEVEQAFKNMTSEAGIYYNLMQEQSKSLTGQISNLGDAWDTMMNEIGKGTQGIASAGISGIKTLIENYETVGKVLVGLIATYGAYKAAVITNIALTHSWTVAARADAVAKGIQTVATKALTIAQAAYNAVLKANPSVLAITAVAALAASMWAFHDNSTEAEKAQEKLNDAIKESEKASLGEQRELVKLKGELSALEKGTDEYNAVKDKIIKNYSKYDSQLSDEIEKVGFTEQAYNRLTEAINKSFGARQYNKFKDEQQNELDTLMSENLGKIQDRLIEKLGEEAGTKYYTKIRNAILQGNVKTGKGYLELEGLDKETMDALDTVAGKEGGWIDVVNRAVERDIVKILNAVKLTEELDKKARIKFGIEDTVTTDIRATEQEREISSITQEIEEATKKIKTLKQELADLRSGKLQVKVGETVESVIEAKEKELQNAQKSLRTLTGKQSTGNSNTKEISSQQKLFDELLQLRFKNQQDEINLMADGAEKWREQIKLDYQKEYAEIQKLENEFASKSGGKLTQEQTIEISRRYTNAEKKYIGEMFNIEAELIDDENDRIKAQEDSWNEYLIKYGNYQEKRKALIEKYNKEIAEAEAGDKAIKREEQKAALEALDEQYGESTRAMADLFEDASEKSVSSIQKIIDKYGLLIKYMSGTKQSDNTSVTVDELKDAGFTEKDIEKIERGEISIKDVTDAIKGLKEELKGKSPWQSFVSDMEKGINKLKTAAGDSQRVGEGITDIGNAVTEFSPALEEFGNSIANIFGVEDSNIAEITNTISGLGQTASGIGQIMSGDIIGGTMGAINGISAIVSAFRNIHDKKNEKQIRQLQEQIDALDRSYEKLGKSADESYSTDAAKKIEQQNEMLEQQKVLIQQQIKEEQDKKKTDDGRIKEWQEQLDAINEQIGENEKKMQEAITGTSVMSAIDEFAQAYADAWAAGTDAAEASTKAVKSLIQTSLLEFLKKKLSPDVEKFMSNLANYMSDGIISPWEDEQLNRLKERMDATASNYFDQTGKYFEEDQAQEQQSASSRGFGTEMTHEDAGELSGRFTAVYESNLRIEMATQQQTMAITELKGPITAFTETSKGLYNIADETRTILANSYLELQQIRENTGEIIKPIKQMQLDIAEVKQNTSRL